MSMIGHYLRVDQESMAELVADPDGIEDFLFNQEHETGNGSRALDIDKSWHAIHFLLNRNAWEGTPPLMNAVLGGRELGEDLGYGPPRILEASEVREVAKALGAISADQLLQAYDPAALNQAEIYPEGWSDDEPEEPYIAEHYKALVDFFKHAAEAGDAMILYLG